MDLIRAFTVSPAAERDFERRLSEGHLRQFVANLSEAVRQLAGTEVEPLLVVAAQCRGEVVRTIGPHFPDIAVLDYADIRVGQEVASSRNLR